MSYGVIASKTASVRIDGSTADIGVLGVRWTNGRVTLTRLHLTFIPQSLGRDARRVDLNLRDVQVVEITPGRIGKVVGLRTSTGVVYLKGLTNPAQFAKQVAVAVEELRTSRVA